MIAPENKALRPPLKSLPQADGSGKPAAIGSGNWRDPAIFGPLDKKIRHGEPTSPSSRRRKSQRDPQALSPVRAKELEAIIRKQVGPISDFIREHCAAQLRYRPESLKRLVLSLIRKQLPPKPMRGGRPEKAEVTHAVQERAAQLREVEEGRRRQVDWDQIAAQCIPGYQEIRFDWKRRQARKRLSDAVGRRSKVQRAHEKPEAILIGGHPS